MAVDAGRRLTVRVAQATLGSALWLAPALLRAQEPARPVSQPEQAPGQTPVLPDSVVQGAVQASDASSAAGQKPAGPAPLAVVSVEGVQLSGAMQVANGVASIGSSGSISAGEHPTTITLPGRGQIKLCATTRLGLSADASIARSSLKADETPGLMMALDRGAMETNFTTGRNSDVILTPDFRITVSGPGKSSVQVRLGDKGDTCVDNPGPGAPYVTVSGVFEDGVYRVQDGQRVMFEHGSLHEVVDSEKESCGCPEDLAVAQAHPTANPFPAAQSAGLSAQKKPEPPAEKPGVESAQATATLRYNADHPEQPQASVTTAPTVAPPPKVVKKNKPSGNILGRVGRFFRNLFGG